VLLTSLTDGVVTLTLNRPEKRNAFNATLVQSLIAELARTAADPAVRVVAIRGAGRDFCAGADLEEMERITAAGEAENLADARRIGAMFTALRRHPRPVVAVLKGRAVAGGAGLMTACDLVLAQEGSEIGYPEVHVGFVPALVLPMLRRKLPEAVAFELITRGERIGAREAERLGLVRVLPEPFEPAVERWLAELAARPPSALALVKRLLYDVGDLDFDTGMELAARVNVEARMTAACREGVRAFLEGGRGRR
jgi:methylglutaconyl-CoA hydratase